MFENERKLNKYVSLDPRQEIEIGYKNLSSDRFYGINIRTVSRR
jgi:hypothetical protein